MSKPSSDQTAEEPLRESTCNPDSSLPGSVDEAFHTGDPARTERVVTPKDTAGGSLMTASRDKDSGGTGTTLRNRRASASRPGMNDAVGHHASMPPRISTDPRPADPEHSSLRPLAPLKSSRLHSELFHVFISYCVSSGAEKRLAQSLYDELHLVSRDPAEKLNIPEAGKGKYPSFVKKLTGLSQRMNEAKVYLDEKCLAGDKDGLECKDHLQRREIVQGLCVSMVFVPLLSWTDDNKGSLGRLCELSFESGKGEPNNVLLELILALELKEHHLGSVKSIMPVFVGQGGSAFPWSKLNETLILDKVHEPTNISAAEIMRQLKMDEHIISKMEKKTVTEIVDSILKHQGVHFDKSGDDIDMSQSVRECARRILKCVHVEIGAIQSSPESFVSCRPCGQEVIDWLEENALETYAPILATSGLDNLQVISGLTRKERYDLYDMHQNMYTLRGSDFMIGDFYALCTAVDKLAQDQRATSLQQRLEGYRDQRLSGMTIMLTRGNTVDVMLSTRQGRLLLALVVLSLEFFAAEVLVLALRYGLRVGVCVKDATGTFCLVGDAVNVIDSFASNARNKLGFFFAEPGNFKHYVLAAASAYCAVALFYIHWCIFLSTRVEIAIPRIISKLSRAVLSMAVALIMCGFVASIAFQGSGIPYELYVLGVAVLPWYMLVRYRQEYAAVYLFCLQIGSLLIIGLATMMLENWKENLVSDVIFFAGALEIGYIFYATLSFRFAKARAWANVNVNAKKSRDRWESKLTEYEAALKELSDLVDPKKDALNKQRRAHFASLSLHQRLLYRLRTRSDRYGQGRKTWKVRQLHCNLDLLYAHAALISSAFQDRIGELIKEAIEPAGQGASSCEPSADQGCDRLVRGPIKQPHRAIEKATRLYRRDCSLLTDLVRCTCVMNDAQEVSKLCDVILKEKNSVLGLDSSGVNTDTGKNREQLFRVLKIRNHFDTRYNAKSSAGYRTLLLNVEVGWDIEEGEVAFKPVSEWSSTRRHICEVQVHLNGLNFDARKEGHVGTRDGTWEEAVPWSVQPRSHDHEVYLTWRDLQ